MPIPYQLAHTALCEAHYQIGLAFARLRTDEQWETAMCREPMQRALDAILDALSATEATTVEERRGLETVPPSGEERRTDPAPPMNELEQESA